MSKRKKLTIFLKDSRIIMLRKVSPKEFEHYIKAFNREGSTDEEKGHSKPQHIGRDLPSVYHRLIVSAHV
jgi:hypothetical protein